MLIQAEQLTRYLTSIKSYNGTDGESEKADAIAKVIRSFPYFLEHPDEVWIQEIPNDPFGRKNVWARLKGLSSRTVLFHSHIDTVETDDFGPLQKIAHNSDALEHFFTSYDADSRVQVDALSEDWLFGRGALDMQSGIAVHLVNLLAMSEQKEPLEGNMLFLFNSDEESEHAGILAALHELEKMKQQGMDYIAAINNDFIGPLFDGDPHKYIYTGAAGKVLPCFYIYGREAHVGDILTSIDPTQIGAELNRRINQNLELAEPLEGEYVLPPACLYFKDDKHHYNVQTAVSARLYFNYFVFERTAKDVLDELMVIAKEACEELRELSRGRYEQFHKKHQLPVSNWDWKLEVVCFDEFVTSLRKKGLPVEDTLNSIQEQYIGKDRRDAAFAMVEALQQLDPEKKPRVIIFFAPPFLPHNFLNEKNEYGNEIKRKLTKRLNEVSSLTGESFMIKRFFPYLADGSFLSLHESEEEVEVLEQNMPRMEILYPLPIHLIKKLNIPSINIGVYGKDGHKWTERVYKPYTFGILPNLIREFALDLVAEKERLLL
nr:M20/M25/M40 family metallo-hydrolase [Jeotgalibacillus soli]